MSEFIHITDEAYDHLCALLDERRKMMRRHAREKAKMRGSLALALDDKLAVNPRQVDELVMLNKRIDELKSRTGETK